MKFDVSSYAKDYYDNIKPAGGNEYPRLKAWEFIYEHIWGDKNRSWADLTGKDGLETTALHIGFYLANWGMFRGSSKLLRNSNLDLMKDLAVLLLTGRSADLFELSLEDFRSEAPKVRQNQAALDAVLDSLTSTIKSDVKWTDTLKTKILLGIWGEFPALDTYYCAGCKAAFKDRPLLRKANGKGLTALADLIQERDFELPKFYTSKKRLAYPKARIMDMALFEYGRKQ